MTLSVVHGEINPAAESRMDCRKEGQEEERPVKMLLGNPSTKAFGYIEEGEGEGEEGSGEWRTLVRPWVVGRTLRRVTAWVMFPVTC